MYCFDVMFSLQNHAGVESLQSHHIAHKYDFRNWLDYDKKYNVSLVKKLVYCIKYQMFKILTFQPKLQPSSGESDKTLH